MAGLTPLPLMQLVTGAWAFKTLAVAVELDLFTRLSRGATAAELAEALSIQPRPSELLLLSNVLHSFSAAHNQAIRRKCYAALARRDEAGRRQLPPARRVRLKKATMRW